MMNTKEQKRANRRRDQEAILRETRNSMLEERSEEGDVYDHNEPI